MNKLSKGISPSVVKEAKWQLRILINDSGRDFTYSANDALRGPDITWLRKE